MSNPHPIDPAGTGQPPAMADDDLIAAAPPANHAPPEPWTDEQLRNLLANYELQNDPLALRLAEVIRQELADREAGQR